MEKLLMADYYLDKIGVSLGMILAGLLSYSHNHDFLWAIIHGILSWIYIIYYVIILW